MSQEILKKWVVFAKADLDAANRLLKSPKPTSWTFLFAAWHCHQTIEKMLKMVMIKKGKDLLKIHDLSRLLDLSEIQIDNETKKFIYSLNKFYIKSRYPDILYAPLPKINKQVATEIISQTNKLFIWLKKQ